MGAFTIRSVLEAHGRSIEQVQFVAEHYVVTVLGGMVSVFAPGLGGRYRVERSRRRLVRLEGSGAAFPEMQRLFGEPVVDEERKGVELNGRCCRFLRVVNRGGRLPIRIECWCDRVEGLRLSALPAEREFDASRSPGWIPLQDDEVVCRAALRVIGSEFEYAQTLRLQSVARGVEGAEWWEELLRYPVHRG